MCDKTPCLQRRKSFDIGIKNQRVLLDDNCALENINAKLEAKNTELKNDLEKALLKLEKMGELKEENIKLQELLEAKSKETHELEKALSREMKKRESKENEVEKKWEELGEADQKIAKLEESVTLLREKWKKEEEKGKKVVEELFYLDESYTELEKRLQDLNQELETLIDGRDRVRRDLQDTNLYCADLRTQINSQEAIIEQQHDKLFNQGVKLEELTKELALKNETEKLMDRAIRGFLERVKRIQKYYFQINKKYDKLLTEAIVYNKKQVEKKSASSKAFDRLQCLHVHYFQEIQDMLDINLFKEYILE
uniref:Uncharacterized protein n=1 Tax=Panagrolaimus sp. JU765 TaxID=591449 RepID=A0AC34QKC4_9BILA